jgi:hypothetical protein
MATLWEYYLKDRSNNLCINREFVGQDQSGKKLASISAALHIDFESNSLYISFYIPHQSDFQCPSRVLLNSVSEILAWKNEFFVQAGTQGGRNRNHRNGVHW